MRVWRKRWSRGGKALVLSALVGLFCLPVCAVGEVAGKIYSTDILAYVNGHPAPSYNMGGKTVIVLEDLAEQGYGFRCEYQDETRTLTVETQWYDTSLLHEETSVVRGKPGRVVGTIYNTDIRVYINGTEISAYNLGGKTAVCVEDLGKLDGSSPNEAYGYSKYLCRSEWDPEERTISLDCLRGETLESTGVPWMEYVKRDNVLSASFHPMHDYSETIYQEDLSEEFAAEPYQLRPLYLETEFGREEIGLCYVNDNAWTIMVLDHPIDDLLWPLMRETTPYEQAIAQLNDGVRYRILDRLETRDYMFLVVEDLQAEESSSDVSYVAAAKTGGFFQIMYSSTFYTSRILTQTEENTVRVTVSPFAGPPGSGVTSMTTEFHLDEFYEKLNRFGE